MTPLPPVSARASAIASATAPDAAASSTAPAPAAADARLDALVARVLQADDVPAFSKAMQELMSTIGRDDASAQRLANVVLRDYALTVKVLRAANAAHYNRTGRAVQSATHALMLLGARTVRDLASALLLFEHYRRRSPGLKELMLLSLLTASTARATAERCGAGVDPDAVYLAGMFRNLGEVLAAAHLPDEYAGALSTLTGPHGGRDVPRSAPGLAVARSAAARAALGCSYEEIGATVARHWGMPDVVRLGMHATGGPGEDLSAVCTAFAHELTAAIHRGEPVHAPPETTRLLIRYGERLRLTRESMREIAERAVEETREVFAAAGVRLDDLRLTRQVAAAMLAAHGADGSPAPNGVRSRSVDHAAPSPSGHGAPEGDGTDRARPAAAAPNLVEVRGQLATELAAAVADPACDLARVLTLALEAVLRGGPFDRAGFHAADPVAREFRLRTGLGDGVDRLLSAPGIPFDAEHGPAGPALGRGEEVHLAHGVRLTLAESQLLRRWDAVSASLYPVRVSGAVIGCVHADRHTAFAAPEAATTQYVRGVVRVLEGALARRRGRGEVPEAPTPPSPEPPKQPDVGLAMSVKMDAVLRVLRGESLDVVAAGVGVGADTVAQWRQEFLVGAAARLGGAL